MKNLLRTLFIISLDEVLPSEREFIEMEESMENHLTQIGVAFLHGYHHNLLKNKVNF
ncbi:hypothetical protein [Macrococcus capreoli]|uniref:hypothetical protein n=1 Tax=Macrococcus capreoli TaxID=2982690 RepID=UPI003EE731E1